MALFEDVKKASWLLCQSRSFFYFFWPH